MKNLKHQDEELENKKREKTTSRQLNIHCLSTKINNILSSSLKININGELRVKGEKITIMITKKSLKNQLGPTTSGHEKFKTPR